MDHDTENKIEVSYYECQVCDRRDHYRHEEERKGILAHWIVFKYQATDDSGQVVAILTCPMCCRLGTNGVLAGYKRRIRSGRDLNFH